MRTGKNSLLELYKVAPNSQKFMDKISGRELDKVAKQIIRDKELGFDESMRRLVSHSERRMSEALLRIGIRVMFEPVCFAVPEINGMHKPDFFTNMYIDNRIVAIEVHGFEWLLRKKWNQMEYFDKYVNKICMVKKSHPNMYFIFVSDMKRGNLENQFGVSANSFCDKYINMPNPFRNINSLVGLLSNIKNRQNTRVEEDNRVWYTHMKEIVHEELKKLASARAA